MMISFSLLKAFKISQNLFQDHQKLLRLVRKFYLGDDLITAKTLYKYGELMNDVNFFYPNYKSIDHHKKHAKTYYVR